MNDTIGLQDLVYQGQTVTFVTLVMIQLFGNLFICRAHYASLWSSFPLRKSHRNLWLIVAQVVSICLMILLVYVPFINTIFLTRPIPVQFYFFPLGFNICFVAWDECRLWFVRRNYWFFVKTAW